MVRLLEEKFASRWEKPLGGNVGIDDVGRHRSRSSRTISSVLGKGPGPGGVEACTLKRYSNARFRRFNSSAVGTNCCNRAITSAAIELRFFRARARRAS